MAERAAHERRADARRQRREGTTPRDDATVAEAADAVEDDPAEALRAAASAAIAAAAVGAARALARRRYGDPGEHDEEAEWEDAAPSVERDEDDEDEDDGGHAGRAAPPLEGEHEIDDGDERGAGDSQPRRPVSPGDARRMAERAREQLRELRSADAESVSSVRRTSNGWSVALDVVEVRRIPESTDVLGTYEVELDDDGELVTFARTRRYYRAEADHR